MRGWWCVRYGDALAWVEAPSGAAAVRRSLDLAPMGDWTDDVQNLVVFPQDRYPEECRTSRLHPRRSERRSIFGASIPVPRYAEGPNPSLHPDITRIPSCGPCVFYGTFGVVPVLHVAS